MIGIIWKFKNISKHIKTNYINIFYIFIETTNLHFVADQIGNLAPIVLLTVAHQLQSTIGGTQNVLASIFADSDRQSAYLHSTEELGNLILIKDYNYYEVLCRQIVVITSFNHPRYLSVIAICSNMAEPWLVFQFPEIDLRLMCKQ